MIELTIRPPHWTLLKGFIETPTLICYLFRFVLPENVYCHSVPAASMALTASSKAADGVSLSMPEFHFGPRAISTAMRRTCQLIFAHFVTPA